jgi:hypothetical protein
MKAWKIAHLDAHAVLGFCRYAASSAEHLEHGGLDMDHQLRLGFEHLEHPEAIQSQHLLSKPYSVAHGRGLLVVAVRRTSATMA